MERHPNPNDPVVVSDGDSCGLDWAGCMCAGGEASIAQRLCADSALQERNSLREYPYLLLDVFTDRALAGNQLAVFRNAAGLSGAEMQALARETNLSETSFCFPDDSHPDGSVPVRIFTTEEELPFAGHPTLGTATALRWIVPALAAAAEIRLRLKAGAVPVRFADVAAADGVPFGQATSGEMEQPLPQMGQVHDRAAVAEALGLPLETLDPVRPVQTVSTGLPFVVVPLVSVEALRALAVSRGAAETYLAGTSGRFFYVVAPGAASNSWRARMQFYNGEDPATGSAAGCATAYLVHHGFAPAETVLRIDQGVEMGRPSTLFCRARLVLESRAAVSEPGRGQKWDASSYVRVGGSTVPVAEGRFFLS